MGKLIIVKDKKSERFTKSTCPCKWCADTHREIEWFDSHKPKTNVAKRLKSISKKITLNYNR